MKQWRVRIWQSGQHPIETIVNARDYFEAKRVAAAMFNCKESEVSFVTEIK
jgi:hypothetical protein